MLIMCFAFLVKLNGGRYVTGILRGFDPFMNIVVDESIEETKEGHKKNIGMVVSPLIKLFLNFFLNFKLHKMKWSECKSTLLCTSSTKNKTNLVAARLVLHWFQYVFF